MTSRPLDILVSVDRGHPRTLGRQIEDQLRNAIRDLALRPGSRLPSTRDLAHELGVSRPIVVDAYAQLAGEGYLELRPGTTPRVTGCAGPCQPPTTRRPDPAPAPLYDLRPGDPDQSSFPRSAWLRSLREALGGMRDADFGYTDLHGSEVLRLALRDYLGRVRGVVADASRVVITSGWCQGRNLLWQALASMETGRPLSDVRANVQSAIVYIGAPAIVRALEQGANVIIAGRDIPLESKHTVLYKRYLARQ